MENKKKNGHNMLVKFKLAQDGQSTDGAPIKSGYPLRKYYPLQQSENENAPDFRRDIAILFDAAFKVGEDKSQRPDVNMETIASLSGREVIASVKVEDDETYGQTNAVGLLKAVD